MTTMVKVTGLTINDAKECLKAALGYLEKIEDQTNISLTVTPNYYVQTIHPGDNLNLDSSEKKVESYSFSIKKNGKVE